MVGWAGNWIASGARDPFERLVNDLELVEKVANEDRGPPAAAHERRADECAEA